MFNKELVLKSFADYMIKDGKPNGGVQLVFKFYNGYGASLIYGPYSYGNEIAVLRFTSDTDWGLCYSTEITNDVVGHLDTDGVIETLNQIKSL